jgi:hypothetical protein
LIEDAFDLRRRHLPMVVVIEITMHAALVAAVSHVHMNGYRDAEVERLLTDIAH